MALLGNAICFLIICFINSNRTKFLVGYQVERAVFVKATAGFSQGEAFLTGENCFKEVFLEAQKNILVHIAGLGIFVVCSYGKAKQVVVAVNVI